MTFTNIQIYNLANKLSNEQIEEKIKKFKESLGYIFISKNDSCNIIKAVEIKNYVKILYSQNNKFVTIYDSNYTFKSLNEDKSYIRKLSKTLTLPVFSVTCLEDKHVIIEQYNFNKRIYDYLSIGNMYENVKKLGFENADYFNNIEIWKDYFVGRNDIDKLNKVIKEGKDYSNKSYIIEEMFSLYGVNKSMSLFNVNTNNDEKVLYFK